MHPYRDPEPVQTKAPARRSSLEDYVVEGVLILVGVVGVAVGTSDASRVLEPALGILLIVGVLHARTRE